MMVNQGASQYQPARAAAHDRGQTGRRRDGSAVLRNDEEWPFSKRRRRQMEVLWLINACYVPIGCFMFFFFGGGVSMHGMYNG